MSDTILNWYSNDRFPRVLIISTFLTVASLAAVGLFSSHLLP
jgi:hypothetical protein